MKALSHKSCWCAVGEALSINFSFACLPSLLLCCALSLAVSVSEASEFADAAPTTFQRSSGAYAALVFLFCSCLEILPQSLATAPQRTATQ
jgi:hypothetical protein